VGAPGVAGDETRLRDTTSRNADRSSGWNIVREARAPPLHSDHLTAASVYAAAAAASPSAAFLCSLSCHTKSEQHAVSTRDEKRDSLAFTLKPCL
jgi:hypothetical protein